MYLNRESHKDIFKPRCLTWFYIEHFEAKIRAYGYYIKKNRNPAVNTSRSGLFACRHSEPEFLRRKYQNPHGSSDGRRNIYIVHDYLGGKYRYDKLPMP